MRNDSIGNYYWDTGRSNNWARPATLNTDLNETYYNRLNSIAQSQVVVHDFGVGAVTLGNDNLANQINDENSIKWNGKVALPTVSEYLRTNANKNCKTLLSYDNNYDVCKNTVWMYFNSGQWWLLSPEASFEMNAFHVNYLGLVHYVTVSGNNYAIRPALYLSADVTLTGSGTQSDPYVINS